MKNKSTNAGCLIALIVLVVMGLWVDLPQARATALLSNPDWEIYLTDYGYSDLLFDKRPGYEGREYLSGEWGAAVSYTKLDQSGGVSTVAPTWLEPNFIYPNWTTNSNFSVLSPMTVIGPNTAQSVIQNPDLNIRITARMIDTQTGIEQGIVPASSAGPGASLTSTPWILRQNYEITVRRDADLEIVENLNLFQFMHGLQSDWAVYDDRNYNGADPFAQYQYDTTLRGPSASINASHIDTLAFHSQVKPVAWEVGRYGVQGVDSHSSGKPTTGVHLSVEADALNYNDLMASQVPPKWISGAQKYDLTQGIVLQPGQPVNFDVLMSVQTKTNVDPDPEDPTWNPGDPHKMHWPQLPDIDSGMGLNVRASRGVVLADDFKCSESGPITDVHIWGSWLNDYLPTLPGSPDVQESSPGNVRFHLSIHEDIPPNTGEDPRPYSRPGELLWAKNFEKGTYHVADDPIFSEEGFLDPVTGEIIGFDSRVWQYNFLIDEEQAFVQEEGKIYWLDVQAFPLDQESLFGWKTTPIDLGWNDDAVFRRLSADGLNLDWIDMHYPANHPLGGESINMAFVITGGYHLQPGDFDGDGAVDAADIALVLANWGQMIQPIGWNTNWDGFVDANEIAAVLSNWGAGVGPAAEPVGDPIPEPATMGLVVMAGLVLSRRRR